jgi:hypothetical protein
MAEPRSPSSNDFDDTPATTGFGAHWRALTYVLNICRFSLLVLIANAALLHVGQGQDLLLAIGEDHSYVILLGSVLLWSFSTWLWTRTLLEIRFPGACVDQVLLARYRRYLPRALALLCFLTVAVALQSAGPPASRYVWPTLLTGAAFVLLVSWRRPVARWAATMMSREQPEQHWLWAENIEARPLFADWRAALASNLGKLAAAFLAAGIALVVWGLASPISLGMLFNTLFLLMTWAATFLPVGSTVTYAANRTGIPLMTLALLLAVVASLWNDNHAIRPLTTQAATTPRPHINEVLRDWETAHCSDQRCDPFVVVAAAGGGIRAAYWTGTVLGYLQQQNPGFDDHLFAVSGVSGGSIGATVFRRMITDPEAGPCRHKELGCLLDVFATDYLAPLSASLLYRDLPQRLLPWPLLPDRALTFERSWEQSYRRITGQDGLNDSFSAASKTGRAWPTLFLNSTWSNNGRRIVGTTVRVDDMPAFSLQTDLLKTVGYDIRLSSAMHNSARFPYVSPAGSWRAGDEGDPTAGRIVGRLQDGGLFENYGAETALEILNYAERNLDTASGSRFKPVVILITSNPALPKDFAEAKPGRANDLAAGVLTTVHTYLNTRVGRGAEAAGRLRGWAERHGHFVYFRMCDYDKKSKQEEQDVNPPLGWALSDTAQRNIQGYLLEQPAGSVAEDGEPLPAADCTAENRAAARQLLDLLAGNQD